MLSETLSKYVGIPSGDVEHYLGMPVSALASDPNYIQLLQGLDLATLESSMTEAHTLLEQSLPGFTDQVTSEYALRRNPMSGYTLANWLLGYLNYPEKMDALVELHDRVPSEAIRKYLPAVISMLDNMGPGREMWQRALASVGIILSVG